MLLVKTRLGMSKLHGIGLFADEFIAKGTVTQRYSPLFDPSYTQEEVSGLPEMQRNTILHHAYFDKDLNKLVMPGDDLRYINHNEGDPNILSTPTEDVAARDIQAGEEMTCNYKAFEEGYFARRGIDPKTFG